MIAVILAGGLGTRLRSAVPDLPKPMAPVDGRPFLSHLMDYWIAQGCDEFVLSIGYRAESIRDFFGPRYRNCPLRYAVENVPLGTGGAVFLSSEQVDALKHPRMLVMNGDTLLAADLKAFERFYESSAAPLAVALLPAGSETRYGRVRTDVSGTVVSFGEGGPTGEWINAGLYLIDSGWIRDQALQNRKPCSIERDLFPKWLRDGHRIAGWSAQAPFLDIGLPESYARTGEFIRGIGKK